jgi:hypothetical protein
MATKITFYRLTKKFVDAGREREEKLDKQTEDILYYTLGVGHHTGIIDCLEECLSCSGETYDGVLALLPEGDTKTKLEGLKKFGEIQIDKGHVAYMLPVMQEALKAALQSRQETLDADGLPSGVSEVGIFTGSLIDCLEAIDNEAALYMIGKIGNE